MAQGDVKVGIVAGVAAAAQVIVQPAAGEHWRIDHAAFQESDYGIRVGLYDGTNEVYLLQTDARPIFAKDAFSQFWTYGTAADMSSLTPLFINNSVYARFYNDAGIVSNFGYSGLQIK